MGFDEEVIRDMSGTLFGGKPCSNLHTDGYLSNKGLQPGQKGYVWNTTGGIAH